MMKRADHGIRSASHRSPRLSFEKTVHNRCPNCGGANLAVYFRSGSRRKVGALCYSCGMVGFFDRDNFFELGRVTPGVIPHRTVSKAAGS